MKITQIMLTQGFGGAERYFLDLSLALADLDYKIQAIYHPQFQYRDKLENYPNITLSPVQAYGTWDLWAGYHIKKQLQAFQPHVVHTHLARGAWLGGKAAAKLNIPTLASIHNYIKLKRYQYIDIFIPSTLDEKTFLINQGISNSRIKHIPHFSRLSPVANPPILNHPPVFIALGRLVKKKGMDVLLQAFAYYLQQGGKGTLKIGGDGEEYKTLLDLCQQLNITDKVTFCGWVDNVDGFLKQGDIFILPSLHEPFGIVVLEAMALGLPIITTQTQGPLAILSSESAHFVPPKDAIALAKAMRETTLNPELTYQKAVTSLNLYKTEYTVEALIPKILQIYQDTNKY
ncbi:glycosyltransferase family 4 protein [Candidatus Nitrosacidococcus tergens]|uniref:Putative Glycosyl transferase group 1 n=1 Tax=Candidatus Nitrosacidococcus tergens TaxID=553981 RepID=A0A7G1QB05_9GAMM|nr:glycosyltransferase family 4 protein [Candidatus Nitrosacidococcus tergens]CAB1276843.1 putative Glycosyl transferase group 1 [Candidatus Nitrosacidococcus tergens]